LASVAVSRFHTRDGLYRTTNLILARPFDVIDHED
jgi:hypothetical protein